MSLTLTIAILCLVGCSHTSSRSADGGNADDLAHANDFANAPDLQLAGQRARVVFEFDRLSRLATLADFAVTIIDEHSNGACTFAVQPPPPNPHPGPSAGTITLDGAAIPISISYGSNQYTGQRVPVATPWSGGESLTIHAPGATVPAFSEILIAPSPLVRVMPDFSSTDQHTWSRAHDVAVSWTGQSAGGLKVGLSVIDNNQLKELLCVYPAADGQGVISAADLSQLPNGMVTFLMISESEKRVQLNGWGLTMQVRADIDAESVLLTD